MAYSVTLPQLQADALAFLDETSEEYLAAFDGILQQAETDVLRDLNLNGFRTTVAAGACTINNPVLAYPAGVIKTDSFWVTVGGVPSPVYYRSNDWVKAYGVAPAGPPKYYAEVDSGYYLAPTPDLAYVASVNGIKRPAGLSDSNPSTWISANVGDLLFRKLMLLSEEFLIGSAPISKWQGEYQTSLLAARKEFGSLVYREFAGP